MSAIHLQQEDNVAILKVDNIARHNALTVSMLEQLEAHCEQLEQQTAARVILLCAAGDSSFCVGADINAWAELPAGEFARRWVRVGHRVFDRLAQLSMPTIAVINGLACGGGLELIAACDLRVAAPKVSLSMPETGLGVVPGWSGTQRLATLMPSAVLNEMLLLGDKISAQRAYEVGFINQIADDPLAVAHAMANQISTRSPFANEITKYMTRAARGEDRAALIEALGGGLIAASDDKQEGVSAFRAKRKPQFSKR